MDQQAIKVDHIITSSVATINQSRSSTSIRNKALMDLKSCLIKLQSNRIIIKELSSSKRISIIDCLCDVYANKQRSRLDFDCLLMCLQVLPNDCSVMRGKIFQHLQVHVNNSNRNQPTHPLAPIIADCMARVTVLAKKGVPQGGKTTDTNGKDAWKQGLANQLIIIEQNVDLLCKICNIASPKVIGRGTSENTDNSMAISSNNSLTYDVKILSYIRKIDFSSHTICSLIALGVQFEKPIPVTIILRVYDRLSNIRWKNYPKQPHGQDKLLIYSHSISFIRLHLMVLDTLIKTCNRNIITNTSYINDSVLSMLEWTRIGLEKTLERAPLIELRCSIYQFIESVLGVFFLNINLEQTQLEKIILTEIFQDSRPTLQDDNPTQELFNQSSRCSSYESYANIAIAKLTTRSLKCLNKLIIVYKGYLDPILDTKIKRFAIVTCLDIYRDFCDIRYPYSISHCRLELIKLLTSLANESCSTSTSEIVDFILEQAIRLESDSDISFTCQRSLKNSLARPILVSHQDAYSIFGRHMDLASEQLDHLQQEKQPIDQQQTEQQQTEQQQTEQQQIEQQQIEQQQIEQQQPEKQQPEKHQFERQQPEKQQPEKHQLERQQPEKYKSERQYPEKQQEPENITLDDEEDVVEERVVVTLDSEPDTSDMEVEQMMKDFVDTVD